MIQSTQEVAEVLEHALTEPAAIPGRRLRSERDLALVLGVGRRQVNEALNQLARRGLLSRTRGSGTYVLKRATPTAPRLEELQQAWRRARLGDPEQMFLPLTQSVASAFRRPPGQPLRLCLCGDWLSGSPVHHAIVERMLSTAQSLGHQLSIISVLDVTGRPLSTTALRQHLQTTPADGYLVVDRWGDLFLRAANGIKRPAIFCGTICGLRHEPAVGVCPHVVIPHALRRLSEEGYGRIAMIGYYHSSNTIEAQQDVYDSAVSSLGLAYRQCRLIRLGDLRGAAIIRDLLESPERPDAIFLSDEFLAPSLVSATDSLGLVIGRDLGLICFTNRGISDLPPTWSRFEVDIRQAGQLAVETLLHAIESNEEPANNILIHPRWRPGKTHLHVTSPSSARIRTPVTNKLNIC